MNIYLVYCDFQTNSSFELAASEILNQYKGIRFLPNGWMILSLESAAEIYQKFSKVNFSSGYLMISKLDKDFACHQPENIAKWIRNNMAK